MARITRIEAFEVLDSRGTPTVQAVIELSDGSQAKAAVPSGASVGKREAHELRDGDTTRFNGKGVLKAVHNVNSVIADKVVGMDAKKQTEIDNALIDLDATSNKARLGANAILSVSLAVARVSALAEKVSLYEWLNTLYPIKCSLSLPVPLFNILNGGVHGSNSTDFQEFMIVPHGFDTFSQSLRAGVEVFLQLGKQLSSEGFSTNVGFEGGYAPSGLSNLQALEQVTSAIQNAGYLQKEEVGIALDVAASEFYNSYSSSYKLKSEGVSLSSKELVETYKDLQKRFPIVSIEDGLSEDDWGGWQDLTSVIGEKTQIVGDDLFVTQKEYLHQGIKKRAANAILVKLNQVGTLTETIDTVGLARRSNFNSIISHRSGETEDTFIADLVVGLDAGQFKAGAPSRGERTAKYNRLIEIERALGSSAKFSKFSIG